MRVKIFEGRDIENNINAWIEEMEGVYIDFEIIEIGQSAGNDGMPVISVWYENEIEEVPFIDYEKMDN